MAFDLFRCPDRLFDILSLIAAVLCAIPAILLLLLLPEGAGVTAVDMNCTHTTGSPYHAPAD
ncbi:hypothetical protein KW818_06795 [Enterobacter quasiroggenkampii]|uniref:hypothetical protein n=1 Tax=Enterobacter quasiroggenkampii TaxID=2497436 RepID=UPI0021D1E62F|nr:hypothetical protein [Enterobacter quasiroggenkampii]MCU6388829.1 hypothetical protein [Enterobacter quasiroggenkampii]